MSSPEIKFDCPKCSEGLAIDRRAIGHQVACPFCKDPITVPEVEEPAEISVEPIPVRQELPSQISGSPSLEDLASSRPKAPVEKLEQSGKVAGNDDGLAPAQAGDVKKGGLPPKRKPGEQPKAVAESAAGTAVGNPPMPPDRGGVPVPPAAAPQRRVTPPPPAQPLTVALVPDESQAEAFQAQSNGDLPAGYEEKVRSKRKRRNPDEHRLNPREHPKMVPFDEVVDEASFRRHPGTGRMPWWKKLGVFGAILGIIGCIVLAIVKKQQLAAPNENLRPVEQGPLDSEFKIADKLINAFLAADSVTEKMSFIRVPITKIDGYPSLKERVDDYYSINSNPLLYPGTTELIEQGDTEFLKIEMKNSLMSSFVYFEKSATGYALDFDSFVGYNPVSWKVFLVNPTEDTEPQIFRLIVEPEEFYTGRFQDKTRYKSYRITDMVSSMDAIAYLVRGTTAADAIEVEFDKLKGYEAQRLLIVAEVNLDERGVDGKDLTYIDKVLRMSWLLP